MNSLENILNVPRFNDLRILTDKIELSHLVSSVEITETPDIAQFIPSNTLILTTGMYYKNKMNEFFGLIDSLAIIDCAGLCIKTGRFIDEIPINIIDYATKKNIPIIEIDSSKPLGGLFQDISQYLSGTKEAEITYALDIQKKFSTLLLNDASVRRIANEFGNMLDTPIIVFNSFKKEIAVSNNWGKTTLSTDFVIEQLHKQHAFTADKNQTIIISNQNTSQTEACIYPIKNNPYFPYYLMVLSPECLSYPISEFAIEQGLMVLSYTLLKSDKLYEAEKIRKSDYLEMIIKRQEQHTFDNMQLFTYENSFDLEISNFYQVIRAHIKSNKNKTLASKLFEEKQKLAYEWLDKNIKKYLPKSTVFLDKEDGNTIILLQQPVKPAHLKDILVNYSAVLNKLLPIELIFSCGNSYPNLDKLNQSLTEANIAANEMTKTNNSDIVIFYKPRYTARLLDNLDSHEVTYFCESILGQFAYPKNEVDIELRKTLYTFLSNQCEITKTANQLFIHRNTVKYRIDNIEQALALTIETPENSFNLRLALKLSDE